MKLTLLNKCGVYLTHDENDPNTSVLMNNDFFPPDLFNCQSGDDIVRKLVWSEIIGDKPIDLCISLGHFGGTNSRASRFIQLDSAFDDEDSVDIIKQLRTTFKDNVKISVYIKPTALGPCLNSAKEAFDFSPDRHVVFLEGLKIREGDVCVCFGSNIKTNLKVDLTTKFNVTVIADINNDNERIRRAIDIAVPLKTNKRILEEGLASDVILIAGNGCEIKAHKNFLIGCSSVLEKMFVSGMKESQTSRVNMTDLSEKTVKAFLRFLYYGDKIPPEENIDIAFELLYAAHKYDVSNLESFMMSHLNEREDDDYGVKLAFKMYTFLRGMGTASDSSELKAKIVRILRRNYDELKALPEYQELFLKTPFQAMELTEQFAKGSRKRIKSTDNDDDVGSKLKKV